jgi:CDP-paratose 2-epimerase
VLDYNKSFGLMTTTMRQSCIYGPRQFGIEDQGWVAWFIIAAVTGRLLTIYGDGKQTRDVLHVADLLVAYDAAISKRERVAGQAFNIGGGPDNILSLLDLLEKLEEILDSQYHVFGPTGGLGIRAFVSDISKAR